MDGTHAFCDIIFLCTVADEQAAIFSTHVDQFFDCLRQNKRVLLRRKTSSVDAHDLISRKAKLPAGLVSVVCEWPKDIGIDAEWCDLNFLLLYAKESYRHFFGIDSNNVAFF